jgi:lipopolysaccharide transport system permease protein
LVGLMAWNFFATGTNSGLSSIVGKANLVTRVYIPRQILVLSNSLSGLINALLTFVVLVIIIAVVQRYLPVTTPLFLAIFIPFFFFIYGAGLLLSSLYVYFRDLNQIWGVLVQVLFFASPIFYPISIVPASLLPYYQLNPVTQFIGMFRDVMVSGNLPSLFSVAVAVGFAVAAFVVGNLVFGRLQRRFAEELA